jgi:2-desacetyl-2-hydroxyethyl bacteriochlorophyllide A dehydrogenase
MKAAVYFGPRDIRVEDVDTPQIGQDEILVRVRACGICGSDLHIYRLGLFEGLTRPAGGGLVLGHELAGEVVEVGAQAARFRVGDRVAGAALGGFAEYVPVQITDSGPHLLPDCISFTQGATLEPLATSLHAVSLARLSEGETVVILGSGIIGLGCVQVLRAGSSCRIIVVDASTRRLDTASELGADYTVNLTEINPLEAVIELTGSAQPEEPLRLRGGSADVVIDCAGAVESLNQGLHMLKQTDGRLVCVALFEQPPTLEFNQLVRKHVTLHGSWAWTGDDFRQAIALVQSGNVDREPLITHEYGLEEAAEAFAMQDRPDMAIKVVIRPW